MDQEIELPSPLSAISYFTGGRLTTGRGGDSQHLPGATRGVMVSTFAFLASAHHLCAAFSRLGWGLNCSGCSR